MIAETAQIFFSEPIEGDGSAAVESLELIDRVSPETVFSARLVVAICRQ
jgi:hypothetical protein